MTMIHLLYSGNGTTPVDSGLPHVGRIFAVPTNGDLNWYRYLGHGEPDRSGTLGWQPNSGNPIGNGWQNFRHVLGAGDGVVLAVQPDGDLLWYPVRRRRAARTGRAPPAGTPTRATRSATAGRTFVHLFVLPPAGPQLTGITVFGVEPNGDLRWYQYHGNGERDRSGGFGWDANSSNIVGNGWAAFQRVVGEVATSSRYRPTARSCWYSYQGTGVADRSGATGWHANSGHQVGRGWQNFRHLTGGTDDSGGIGTVLYAVAQNGDLLWYRYHGRGEQDPTGGTGGTTTAPTRSATAGKNTYRSGVGSSPPPDNPGSAASTCSNHSARSSRNSVSLMVWRRVRGVEPHSRCR